MDDPTEHLRHLRYLARRLTTETNPDPIDARRMAELALEMDEWLSRGGALPDDWQR
jgi:hypothetical protein